MFKAISRFNQTTGLKLPVNCPLNGGGWVKTSQKAGVMLNRLRIISRDLSIGHY